MTRTKIKILDAALKRFNRDGFVNVRLQHIADEAAVSVGNLAYHFYSKEVILKALYEALTKKQKALLAEYRIVPLFDNINRLLSNTFQLQQQYLFFYVDTLELTRAYPDIGQAHRRHILWQIEQLKTMLDFNAARGVIIEEEQEGTFEKLAKQIWMTTDFWWTQQLVRSEKEPEQSAYLAAIWHLLYPYFTEMGRQEYRQMLQSPYDFYF